MISDAEIERVAAVSAKFKPALTGARYHADSDRIELITSWCTLLVDRRQIDELRDVSKHDLETITVSAVGLHVEGADIDINAAGLLSHIGRKLARQAAKSI
jgi:uncharacterized protein YjiS (DUF1127 family)